MSDSCDPVDRGAWQATVHGVLQARMLEWVAISFSRDLPDPGIEPLSPALASRFFITNTAWEAPPDAHFFLKLDIQMGPATEFA